MSEVVSVGRSKRGRSIKQEPSRQAHTRQADDGDKEQDRQINPWLFIRKLVVWSLLVSVCAASILSFNGIAKLGFQLCMGLLLAHSTELVHQCLHRLATGNATWDQLLGMALGWPSGVSFWHYQWFHFWHHKHNGTEEDVESFGYVYQMMESPSRTKRLFGFIRHLSMIGHYRTALWRIVSALSGRLADEMQASTPAMPRIKALKIQSDYVIMGGLLWAAVLASAALRTWVVIEVWLIPLLIAWGPAHALIELPEHWGCDRPSADAFANTRSIRAGRPARWYTNNNCNHVGHHLDMNVPMERLADYEERLRLQHDFKHSAESYLHFYFGFFKFLITGRMPKQARAGEDAISTSGLGEQERR